MTASAVEPHTALALTRAMLTAGLDVRPLPRGGSDASLLRRAVSERTGPIVHAGLLRGWHASRAWNPTALAEAHGQTEVTALMELPASGVLLPEDQRQYERTMRFGEFLLQMQSTPMHKPCYLAYTKADAIFPDSDYDFEGLLGHDGVGTDTRAWIGSAGTRSMLHSDLMDNVFCQLWGAKYVVLSPWQCSTAVYPFPDNLVNSQVDLAEPRLDRFPRLRDAVLYAGLLRPGDALFVPRGCWHDFRALTPSVSLNHWFGESLTVREYLRLLVRLGPRYWSTTARDFLRYGALGKREQTTFFYSPPSTGKRLWDLCTRGDFSRGNDPTTG